MSFDGLFTREITKELSSRLAGGRINKIHQPYKNEIILVVRAGGSNHKLLLSAHPTYARAHITEEGFENPKEAPMFCMLLRKHLEGFIIEEIYQDGLDRIIVLKVKGRNEIGDISVKLLIIEIMGRHSNIILIDEEKNMIIDSIKHVSYAVNSHRAILPGQNYISPPKQNKENPFEASEEDVLRKIDFNRGKIDKQIVEGFAGISPLFAKEIVFQSGLANRVTVPRTFTTIMKNIKDERITPTLTTANNKEYFYFLPLEHLKGESKTFRTLSELLDRYYFGKAERDRVKQQGNDLERYITNEKEKNEKKIKKLEQTILEAENREQYQRFGELLTANLYAVQKGMTEIEVLDYYDEAGGTVIIPLNPQKSPSENAQNFFTKYQKAKTASVMAMEQLEKAKEELQYFDTLLQQLQTAAPKDIEEIREELIEGGYLRARQKKGKQQKDAKPNIEKYIASDGTEILVGKNNKQNDYLTNKLAKKDEIWLHTKDIPGSHVVIRSSQPSKQTIMEAATLAAYYSKGRLSSSVPVDYTQIRHVKKPNGAKPGFCIYDNQLTVYVTPDEEKILELKNRQNQGKNK